jgi:cysteine-rich repeat protein
MSKPTRIITAIAALVGAVAGGAVLVGAVTGAAAGDSDFAQANKRVTVCHVPPGNTANAHTISVAAASVSAHLRHGDELGPCFAGCGSNPSICDDGNACTADVCAGDGQCRHDVVSCEDGNACTVDSCDPAVGCTSVATSGAACDDGNACTSSDSCVGTVCQGAPIEGCCATNAECDDGAPCTFDVCNAGRCVNEAVDCSVPDRCHAGFCDIDGQCGVTPISCDDSNACTDDRCDGTSGCVHVPTASPPEPVEHSCTDGLDNDCDGTIDATDSDCPRCGDGVLQPGEQCDDGNDNPFDGCDACTLVDTTPD